MSLSKGKTIVDIFVILFIDTTSQGCHASLNGPVLNILQIKTIHFGRSNFEVQTYNIVVGPKAQPLKR